MPLLSQIAIAAAGSVALGAVAGFVAAILALLARNMRNAYIVARGQPPYRDCILPLPFVWFCVFLGLPFGAIFGAFFTPLRAVLIAGLAPAALLVVLSVGGAITQALRD